MENIKKTLESHLYNIQIIYKVKVRCMEIILLESDGQYMSKWSSEKTSKFYLKEYYTEDEFNDFLDVLNFEYDDGTSRNRFHGNIWYTDGTWSHYTESEFSGWEHYECPRVPDNCH